MSTLKFDCGCEFNVNDGKDSSNIIDAETLKGGMPSGVEVDIYNVVRDCERTWDLICSGRTTGVFQLESSLGKTWAKKVKPRNLEEMAALISIIRPGCLHAKFGDPPKSVTNHFCDRKHGLEQVTYMHPAIENILSSTNGILCIHEDTYVSMADGTEKQIKYLKPKDKTVSICQKSLTNNIDMCVDVKRSPEKHGAKLVLKNGYTVILTPNHKVQTLRGEIKVKDLDVKTDLVQVAVTQNNWIGRSPIDNNKYNDITTDAKYLCYLCGQLVGDGCSGRAIAVGSKEKKNVLLKWLKKHFPQLNIHAYFNVRCWYISISGDELLNNPLYGNRKTIYRWFIDKFTLDKTKNDKIIHDEIMQASDECRRAFLAGLFDADGCSTLQKYCGQTSYSVCHYCSNNPQVINGIRKMLSIDGIATYITYDGLHIHIRDSIAFKKLIEPYMVLKKVIGKTTNGNWYGRYPINNKLVTTGIAKRHGVHFGDIVFMKIKRIIQMKEKQNFYSISIKKNHNLIANGIVISNCYQEQAMQLASTLAGFSLQQADILRKCIAEGSTFQMQNGLVKIEDLCDIDVSKVQVLTTTWTGEHHYVGLKRVWYSGEQPTFKLTTENGCSIIVTGNHEIETDIGWTECRNIIPNHDYVYTYKYGQCGYSKVVSIENYDTLKTYDYQTVDSLIPYAFVNNILVHNSIGKKKADIMASLEKDFVEGCKKQGLVTEEQAKEIFDGIRQSQNYAFNKCLHDKSTVRTPLGFTTLDSLVVGDKVFTKHGYSDVVNVYRNGEKNLFKVVFSNGSVVCCTLDHKFLCDDGVQRPISSIAIYGFLQNNSLYNVICEDGTAKIVSIEHMGTHETIDIEVDNESHTFYVDGIATSNSHAITYGLTGYWTAYLKAHFPVQFYCSFLHGAQWKQDVEDEVYTLVNDAKLNNVTVNPPCLLDKKDSAYVKNNEVYFGLADIKQIGAASLVKVHSSLSQCTKDISSWKWLDYLTLFSSTVSSTVNEALVCCGAVDFLHKDRTLMMYEYEVWSQLTSKEQEWCQKTILEPHLFDGVKPENLTQLLRSCAKPKKKGGGCSNKNRVEKVESLLSLLESPPHSLRDTADFIAWSEERYLGAPLTCHKVDSCECAIEANATCKEVVLGRGGYTVLAVEVKRVNEIKTTKGKTPGRKMAFLSIVDGSCALDDVVVFPDSYQKFAALLYDGNTVLVQGERTSQGSFAVNNVVQI